MRILLILLLSLSRLGQAQPPAVLTWQQTYGSTRDEQGGFAVAQNGGYLLVGQQTIPSGVVLLYFVQTNAVGDTLWTKKMSAPGTLNPYITGLVRNQAGTVLVTGLDYGNNVGFTLALDANCAPLWGWAYTQTAHTLPGATLLRTYIGKPLVDADDNFLLVQTATSSTSQSGVSDDTFLKVDKISGMNIWSARLDSILGSHGYLYDWETTNTGLVAVIGGTNPISQNSGIGILKIGATGRFISFQPRPQNLPYDISSYKTTRDAAGNILLVGRQRLTKLDPQGDTLWHTDAPIRYHGGWDGVDVAQDRQGNYVVLGNSSNYTNSWVHLARFSATGQVLNDTAFARNYATYARSLLQASNGELVISGYAENGPIGGDDLFLLQFRGFRPLASRAETAVAAGVTVYPNPAPAGATAVHLTLPVRHDLGRLNIFDAMGRLVREQAVAAGCEVTVSVAGLPPGLYVLRLTATDGRSWTSKLLRE